MNSCKQRETKVAAPTAPSVPVEKPVQIPQVTEASGDWAKAAHQVRLLNSLDNTPGTKSALALAWTPTALLVQIRTDDATPIEAGDELWNGDSIELFLNSSFGSDDHMQMIFSPGRTAEQPKPRWRVYDRPMGAPAMVAPEVKTEADGKGYLLTLSIPWADLKHVPKPGDVIGLQLFVNDARGRGSIAERTWFPDRKAGSDPQHLQRVQLAAQADPPEIATARVRLKGFNGFAVEVFAVPDAAGKSVAIWSGDKQVAAGHLKAGGFDGESTAIVDLPPDLAKQRDAPLRVIVDGQAVPTTLKVPDLAAARLALLKDQPLVASPSVFDDTTFPKIDFLNKDLIETAVGPYTLHTRYFDANWNEVTQAVAPGRYGAIVEFSMEDGFTFPQDVTLFKTPKTYSPRVDPYGVKVKFPVAFAWPDDLATREEWNINDWVGGDLRNFAMRNSYWAVLLAALNDLKNDPARYHGFSVRKIDNDWWSELHKRQGADQDYGHLTYLPENYDKDPQKKWPLILFLHGSGERGKNLDDVKNDGPLHYINQGHALPFIVVTPQCPADESWNSARLLHLIDEVCAANRVDPKRIYVTGLSMGGYGTWELAGSYPEKFAAIAPVAGGENPALAERLKRMPTWVFHGSEDTVVPTRYSIDLVKAMQTLNAPVKLTLYPGVGHGGWDLTYDNPELYRWFLQNSK